MRCPPYMFAYLDRKTERCKDNTSGLKDLVPCIGRHGLENIKTKDLRHCTDFHLKKNSLASVKPSSPKEASIFVTQFSAL